MDNNNSDIDYKNLPVPIQDEPPVPLFHDVYTNNPVMSMAYSGIRMQSSGNQDVEYRLQRLERGQVLTRRGRVISTFPSFKSQSFISQTSANNPFVPNNINGASFTPGNVPAQIAPTTNSQIKYPRSPR